MTEREIGQEGLRKRPPTQEDEHFAKQDKARLEEEKRKREAEEARLERLRQKELHNMHCPKCGMALVEEDLQGVLVDRCRDCGGLWLDKGEIEKLMERGDGFITTVMRGLFGK